MIRRLYDWVFSLAGHKRADWALSGVSFVESSIFPIPPDVLLIPMVLAKRHRWIYLATICTIASVLGAFFGLFHRRGFVRRDRQTDFGILRQGRFV